MKNILLLLFGVFSTSFAISQITANNNSGSTMTAYTNGAANNPIYIWCSEGLATQAGSLTATPTSGTGPWTFNWYYHNQTNSSWTFLSSSTGITSTINNLPNEGYRVQIYDNGGNLVACDVAWVWNMNGDVTANNNATACNGTNLSGTVSSLGSFTYYNPPPPESIISASTQITVCFSATHTYVSDLAFYLVGPASCGSPTILLSPNPGANGQGSVCNSNNNVNNLCFTTAAAPNFNPCNELCCGFLCLDVTGCNSNYTGTYDSYGPGNTPINWSPLYGCNAAQGGWRVQIYDCIPADVGALTNASISFSNLTSVCGSPTSINYSSGAINSTINDNSCTAATASIFQVPVSSALTNPITINASTTYLWTSNPATSIPTPSSSLTPSVANIPTGTTQFYLTATVSYGGVSCTYVDSTSFTNTCCSATADAGSDISFCTGFNGQIGTAPISGLIYSWSPTTGLSDASVAQPTVTLTNTGTTPQTTVYTVTATNPLDGNCFETDQVSVTVNPTPMVDAGTYPAVCGGSNLVPLIGSPVGGTFNGTGVSGANFNPTAGTQTITYDYTDGNGCSASDQATITVTPQVTVTVSSSNPNPICVGNSVTLTASGALNYIWSPATGLSATTGNTVSATPTSTQTYTITDANDVGCSMPATITVTVNPITVVDAGTYTAVCADANSISLLGTPAGGTFTGTGVSGSSFNPAAGTQTLTYSYVDANGCSATDQTTITVHPLPTINGGADQTICLGTQVTLTGSGGSAHFWDNGGVDGQPFTPGLGSVTYTVTGTNANGCTNTDQVTVNVLPVPDANVSSNVTTGDVPLEVTFYNTSSFGSTYTWSFGNGVNNTVSNLNNQNMTYVQEGTYQIILTASNGICNDYDTMYVIALPIIAPEIIIPNVFTPNNDGANDTFFITANNAQSMNVTIYNRWGEFMYEINGFLDSWNGNTKMGLASDGVYFFKYEIVGLNKEVYTGHGHVTLVR